MSGSTDRRPPYLFVHIPKTAGTTVRHFLHDSFAADEVLFVYPAPVAVPGAVQCTLQEAGAMPLERLQRFAVIYGHFVFRPEWRVHESCRSLAFVRDPAARVVSWFNYVRSLDPESCVQPQRRYVEAIHAGAGLAELFEREAIAEIDNGIVRYLGSAPGVPVGEIGAADVERAQHNIETYFDFVGHAGHFERSMQEIARCLGRTYKPLKSRNVSPGGPAERRLDQHSPELLERLTRWDRVLVEWIEARFFG